MAKVFVITGPSGVGKGTLIRTLLSASASSSCPSRPPRAGPRPGEAHGVDYHFLSDEEFERRVAAGEFVEHARYSGRRYGTLRSELEQRLAGGHPVVLEIEVQGARQIREAMPEAVQIFIAPPSEDALRARLVGRGTDDPEQVAARLATAREELRRAGRVRPRGDQRPPGGRLGRARGGRPRPSRPRGLTAGGGAPRPRGCAVPLT